MSPLPLDRRQLLARLAALGTVSVVPTAVVAAAADENPMSKEAVFYDPRIPVQGNPNGDTTMVVFFDYQCPYCKASQPDVEKLVETDGRIRLVMKDWPIFGPPSLYASRLTLAAGDGYVEAQAALMATPDHLTPDAIEAVLREAGFDPNALNAAYDQDKARINGLLQRNSTQAEAFGLAGTPAYVIGTTLYPGVLDFDAMKQAVVTARKS
ncbi:DsbA family protein [Consotaella aegiceratis]|uniref:DsbA family protein n=1 Tax=Consotaella aegiceratis TaxID=3097961 RepID=UPI002F427FF8